MSVLHTLCATYSHQSSSLSVQALLIYDIFFSVTYPNEIKCLICVVCSSETRAGSSSTLLLHLQWKDREKMKPHFQGKSWLQGPEITPTLVLHNALQKEFQDW